MYVYIYERVFSVEAQSAGALQRGKSPPTSVQDMTQNNLMERLQ